MSTESLIATHRSFSSHIAPPLEIENALLLSFYPPFFVIHRRQLSASLFFHGNTRTSVPSYLRIKPIPFHDLRYPLPVSFIYLFDTG